jgi:hypothetical protein
MTTALHDTAGQGTGGGAVPGAVKLESAHPGHSTVAAVCTGTARLQITVTHDGHVLNTGNVVCGATALLPASWTGTGGVVVSVRSATGSRTGQWEVAVNSAGWTPQS